MFQVGASSEAHGQNQLQQQADQLRRPPVPVVDGQLAYDCLNSVPLHADDAVRLVRSIQPYLEWQSSELLHPCERLRV